MSPALAAALDQTRSIFASVNHPFPTVPGASESAIRAITDATGIHVGDDLAALWRLMDGSNQEKVFAVVSDVPTPVNFLSTDRAIEFWKNSLDLDDEELIIHQKPPRDARIRHGVFSHPRWLPFAEYNEGGTTVYYDTDPGPGGREGQIIVYQHDPDGIYYVASDLASFVMLSNELLSEDPHDYIVHYSGV